MSFDWMNVPRSNGGSKKRIEVMRQEIRERAALLMRLGYSPEEATERCRQNLRWDFELGSEPPLLKEVGDIVRGVVRRTLTLDPRTT